MRIIQNLNKYFNDTGSMGLKKKLVLVWIKTAPSVLEGFPCFSVGICALSVEHLWGQPSVLHEKALLTKMSAGTEVMAPCQVLPHWARPLLNLNVALCTACWTTIKLWLNCLCEVSSPSLWSLFSTLSLQERASQTFNLLPKTLGKEKI